MKLTQATDAPLSLSVERVIPVPPQRVFRAWTNEQEIRHWWGPSDVRCVDVEMDLRVGGQYRIANELPDKSILWISGEFEAINEPQLLVYTWIVENASPTTERVTVRFEPHDSGTHLKLSHELIPTPALKDSHQVGWYGCLDKLQHYLAQAYI